LPEVGEERGIMDGNKLMINAEEYTELCELREKAERYRWHDLRKNPRDLPENYSEVSITWMNHEPESYYESINDKTFIGFSIFRNGVFWWWSSTCEDYLREYGYAPWCAMDEAIEVIAWREIEPFEEVQNDD